MTRTETNDILIILNKIKDPDGYVKKAIAICHKQLAIFDQSKGQLKEHYDSDRIGPW